MKKSGDRFEPAMIECISAGADKGKGLKSVADFYGVPMSEVMAFGDSFNDVPMLKAAGLGVAMGNARDAIKTLADEVAPTNNADGVAKTIEKHCLNNDLQGEDYA